MKIKKVEKPWGYEMCFAYTGSYTGKLLFIRKGCKLDSEGSCTIYCLEGRANITTKLSETTEISLLVPSDSYYMKLPHEIEAKENTVLVEISLPYDES